MVHHEIVSFSSYGDFLHHTLNSFIEKKNRFPNAIYNYIANTPMEMLRHLIILPQNRLQRKTFKSFGSLVRWTYK